VTYAGAYGGNERMPIDRVLRREGHPLGVRRDEATRVATGESEETTANKRWTFGVAAGALLMAGTFAAGALGLTGGNAPVAGGVPDHANASSGHSPGSGPAVGAPVPGQDDKQQPQQQQPQIPQQGRGTTPASADPQGGVAANTGSGASTGTGGSGSVDQQSVSGGDTGTTTPAPTPAPAPAPAPAEEQQGAVGDVVDTVGDVLTPVTDVVGGVLSPLSSTATSPAPSGPALTLINPLGDLLGVG
jgi:hypothetical protein